MKTAQDIISHIVKKPQNSKIVQKGCIDKLVSCLPPHLQNAVMFTYIKNNTLFFVLNHPGLKMEFNYKHNLIKSLLNKIKDIDSKCQKIQVTEIKSFVSNKITPPKPQEISFKYNERASGDFINLATSKELQALFENIRKTINETQK